MTAQPVTVEMAAPTFTTMLADALLFASRDDTLPILNAVRLEVTKNTLRTVTTDRYRMAIVTRPHNGKGKPASFMLSTRDARQAMQVFRPARKKDTVRLSLRFAGDKLTIRRVGSLGVLPEVEVTFNAVQGAYPKYQSILDSAEPAATPLFALDPRFLADFAKVSRLGTEPMRIEPCGPEKPVLIQIGDHFRGLIMPMRLPS